MKRNLVSLILIVGLLAGCNIVEARQSAKQFPSIEVFEAWYKKHITTLPIGNDCDDYAEYVQKRACENGYLISCIVIADGKYNYFHEGQLFWVTVLPPEPKDGEVIVPFAYQLFSGCHMGNFLNIGNEYYYVEPNPLIHTIVKLPLVRD